MIGRKIVSLLVCVALTGPLLADDAFYHLSLGDLQLTDGALPTPDAQNPRRWWNTRDRTAYAVLDGEGEIYVQYDAVPGRAPRGDAFPAGQMAVRVPQARDLTGKLYLPELADKGMRVVGFRIPTQQAAPEHREEFYNLKISHYENLLRQRVPGAAWFRHQSRQARQALGKKDEQPTQRRPTRGPRTSDLEDTFAMFTGGRAMSENLQLDRVLQPATEGVERVAVSDIRGITIQEIDWEPLIKGLKPELDPLASQIPADQHAIFFPTFDAAVKVSDEMAEQGALVLQLAEPRSTSARTFERYQQQMCLELTAMARLLGPTLVQSVAVTGSDPYFRTGTDVAVLFETDEAATLEKLLLAQIAASAAAHPDAKAVDGTVNGLRYRGLRSEDRGICSYLAKSDRVVIVTNSLYQLEQYVAVAAGKSRALAKLDEYTFFRHRYPRADAGETAFLFLSDATIRRWCGPVWRIATSRRTRDAAVISELQASQLDRLAHGKVQRGPIYTDLPLGNEAEITLTATGVQCSSIGSLAFMTPISEMDVARVTKAEAEAYRRWRDRYQNNWRWAFDPIGLRLKIDDQQLAADLTVMPLIWGSDYREIISYSQGAEFAPDAGDLHDSLAHVIMSINTDSPALKRQTNILQMLMGSVEVEPLSWLGSHVGLYVDEGPFWDELAKVAMDDVDEFMVEQGWRIPAAVHADVSSGLKLTLFLGAIRAFIEQASPDMLQWETLRYNEQPYVKVTPSQRAIGRTEEIRNLALYYNASGKSLIVTLNEDVLKRAIDRQVQQEERGELQANEAPAPDDVRPWLGSNLALQVDQELLKVLAALGRDSYQRTMQNRAWSNLPILNEWRRRYEDQDPVELHQQFWQDRLLCPGGGEYVWNDKWQTMESTVYGCPAAPKVGPAAPPLLSSLKHGSFGLTFEDQGLRTRVELSR